MTILTRTLPDLEGYDFTQAEDFVAEIRWTDHRGAVVAESYENVLRLVVTEDEATDHGPEGVILGNRLYWLARRLDPGIDALDRATSDKLTAAEQRARVLGHELDSNRRYREEAEAKWERSMMRAEGLAMAIDVLARRAQMAENEHDETIAELRLREEELDDAKTRIVELEAALREAQIVDVEIVDEEPF